MISTLQIKMAFVMLSPVKCMNVFMDMMLIKMCCLWLYISSYILHGLVMFPFFSQWVFLYCYIWVTSYEGLMAIRDFSFFFDAKILTRQRWSFWVEGSLWILWKLTGMVLHSFNALNCVFMIIRVSCLSSVSEYFYVFEWVYACVSVM